MSNPRYFKSSQDVANDLAIRARNAELNARKQDFIESQAASQRGYLQPGNVQLSTITPGFDRNYGSSAGGMAISQGVDFGSNPYVEEAYRFNQPQPFTQASYIQVAPPENLEQLNLDQFYSDYSDLNALGIRAARAGFDVNNPDPMNADQMEVSRQYREKYAQLLATGQALSQGYEAQKTAQEKGYLIEDHQGATQFSDWIDPDRFDKDVSELNAFAQEMYTRGAVSDANNMLFGNRDGDIYSAAQNYSGRVGAYFFKADQLDAQGRDVEADLIRQKMFDVLGPVYDSTKQQKLSLQAQDLARKAKNDEFKRWKAMKGDRNKYDKVANLQEKIWRLQNQGDIGLIKQNHPDARYEPASGTTYLVFTQEGEEVRIDVNDDVALAAQFMKDNDDFIDVTMADYQEVLNEFGSYTPSADENWQVGINTQGFWSVASKAQQDSSKENVGAVVEYLNQYKGLIDYQGSKVSEIISESDYDTFGTNEIMIKFEDGRDPMYFSMDNSEHVNALDTMLQNVNQNDIANYLKDKPNNDQYYVNPYGYGSDSFDWSTAPLYYKKQLPGQSSAYGGNKGQVYRSLNDSYNIQSFGGTSRGPSNPSTGSGIDYTKMGY